LTRASRAVNASFSHSSEHNILIILKKHTKAALGIIRMFAAVASDVFRKSVHKKGWSPILSFVCRCTDRSVVVDASKGNLLLILYMGEEWKIGTLCALY
jgi:hypothetical protein